MSAKNEYTIGQMLFVVMDRSGFSHMNYPITKIGNKWLTVQYRNKELKVNKETLVIDGGAYSALGQCYIRKTDYAMMIHKNELWADIKRLTMSNVCPKELSIAELIALKNVLAKDE